MVATRRSAGKHVDVELSDNGKELQKVIPIEKQRQLQMKQHHSSSKRETRGRKKKQRKSQDDTPSSSASSVAASSDSAGSSPSTIAQTHPSSSSAAAPVAVKKIETRGRKRKIHDATDNNPHQHNQQEHPNSKKQHLKVESPSRNFLPLYQNRPRQSSPPEKTVSPVESANNVVADKHKINHLLTNDSPPPPPAPTVATNYSPPSSLPRQPLPPTNLITISAPQFVKKPTPLRPVLPTPRTSSISTVVNAPQVGIPGASSSSPSALPNPPPSVALAGSGPDNDNDAAAAAAAQVPLTTITKHSNGRIPITSIISQKIDSHDIPLMLDDDGNGSNGENKKTKRRYRVDRDNIKINKRIMSQDTEDVIRMFKKFDDEVLTNAEARSRLLNLGFETRKRYITTFKHYIRFCCKKRLNHFFVTGELMREFYEEQFALSSSNKPVIRLRKMDPAFSKLQEINFLVYHLENKDIPNRQLALEYLVYKELGQEPPPITRANYVPSPAFPATVAPRPSTSAQVQSEVQTPTPVQPIPVQSPTPSSATSANATANATATATSSVQPPLEFSRRSPIQVRVGTPTRPLSSRVPQTAPPRLTVLQQQPHQGRDGLLMEVPDVQARSLSSASRSSSSSSSSSSAKIDALGHKRKKLKHSSRKHEKQKKSSTSSEETSSSDNHHVSRKTIYLQSSFKKLKDSIQETLRKNVSADPAFVSNLATSINQALEEFEYSNNLQPVLELNNNGVPIIDLNNKIYTVYEIIEEWYQNEPSIAERLKNWGEAWIRDAIDHNTFLERKSVVEFVEKMSKELNADIFTIANDCDRYIRDKSILQEFIAEIDLDVDDLFKKVLRYRQRRN